MVIPDIQSLNVNLQSTMPTTGVATNANAVAAISTGNNTDTSTTNSDSSSSMESNSATKVTLSSDRKRVIDSERAEKKAVEDREEQPDTTTEYSLSTTGIPLYNGKLVSVIKYPDGQSEMFDAFTGKRITQEDLALLSFLQGSDPEQVLTFESTTSYSNMSAAEVYQQIQEMLHGKGNTE